MKGTSPPAEFPDASNNKRTPPDAEAAFPQKRRYKFWGPFTRDMTRVCAAALFLTGVLAALWSGTPNRYFWQKMILMQAYSQLMAGLDSLHERYDDVGKGELLKVVVIHTGSVRIRPEETGEVNKKSLPFSDRAELAALLRAVAKENPKAIGVDIDFSPVDPPAQAKGKEAALTPSRVASRNRRPVGMEDDLFFDEIARLSKSCKIPIFLGVYRQRHNGGEYLGQAEFDPLAAAISVPADNSLYMPISFAPSNSPSERTAKTMLPGLSYAVAFGAWQKKEPRIAFVENPPVTAISDTDGTRRVLINYSPLDTIRGTAILSVTPSTLSEYGSQINGKYVLLGDAAQPRSEGDRFRIPGQKAPVPGVYIHACALYTLLQEPIVEPGFFLRLTLDAGFIFLIPLGLYFGMQMPRKTEKERHELGDKFLSVAAALVGIFGLGLLIVSRVGKGSAFFWFDFVWVGVVFKIGAWIFEWFLVHRNHPEEAMPEIKG